MLKEKDVAAIEVLIVGMLHTVYEDKGPHAMMSMPEILTEIERFWPEISLGELHDILRGLHQDGQLSLIPWTRAYALVPDPLNAIFLHGEVMYWAKLDVSQFRALNMPAMRPTRYDKGPNLPLMP